MSNIILLGGNGSIGSQTINVIEKNSDELKLLGVSIYQDENFLMDLLTKFKSLKYVCVEEDFDLDKLTNKYPNITFFKGDEGLISLASITCDLVVNALVGFIALKPLVAAIKAHNDIALANKECIVSAGELIIKEVIKNHVELYPIDSEHNALYQCLKGESYNEVRRLVITASGGPFRDIPLSKLKDVSVEKAIRHPNWKMGKKISVDSATLVNKGLEVIEAHYLFGFDYDKIDVVMQLESVVHSLVEFNDGSLKALVGAPNMETPIQYALLKGKHVNKFDANLMFNKPFSLNFRPIDFNRFEPLLLAYKVGRLGLSYPLAFNAANEVAVNEFIKGNLPFNQIVEVIKNVIEAHKGVALKDFDEVISLDKKIRDIALIECQKLGGK